LETVVMDTPRSAAIRFIVVEVISAPGYARDRRRVQR
jgi:hypothetical protein